jgi:hypothetical protein
MILREYFVGSLIENYQVWPFNPALVPIIEGMYSRLRTVYYRAKKRKNIIKERQLFFEVKEMQLYFEAS